MKRPEARIVTGGVALMLLAGCAGSQPSTGPAGEPSSPATSPSSAPVPIPEGQSLMDPGSYVAHVEPNAVITTTTPWYGAANAPGFVVFGQLDHFPYAELDILNLDEVIEHPADPGVAWKTVPAPDDLFTWFLETGADVAGEPVTFEIDGYEAHQVDLRITPDTECAPKSTRPWPEACLLIFTIKGDEPAFALSGPGMLYRVVVVPDVDGRTVTIIYSDYANRFPDRVQVADEVIRSITFDV
jgi:hypothetical protein